MQVGVDYHITLMALTANGCTVALGGAYGYSGEIQVNEWGAVNNAWWCPDVHGYRVNCLALSADGNIVVSSGVQCHINVWSRVRSDGDKLKYALLTSIATVEQVSRLAFYKITAKVGYKNENKSAEGKPYSVCGCAGDDNGNGCDDESRIEGEFIGVAEERGNVYTLQLMRSGS